MKGREALIEINGLAKQWARGIDHMEETLRSYGWLHEGDLVEGKSWTCDDWEDCKKDPAPHCEECDKYRPATIRDLIRRDK
jgi:hypothetical protein